MNKLAISLFLSFCLIGCDTYQQSQIVANDLKKAVGSETHVGFNWQNGKLISVTVTFDGIPKEKSLPEIAELVRTSVKKEFAQEPQKLILGFSIKP